MTKRVSFTELENFIPMEYISRFRMEFKKENELVIRKGNIIHLSVPDYVNVELYEDEFNIITDRWYLSMWLSFGVYYLNIQD